MISVRFNAWIDDYYSTCLLVHPHWLGTPQVLVQGDLFITEIYMNPTIGEAIQVTRLL